MLHKTKKIKSYLSKLFESGNFIIFIGILSILPFLIISIFNNPSADDFCYNNISQNLGYFSTQLEAYNGWSGRYMATAILSIKGLVSGSFIIYKCIPVVLLTFLGVSIYHLCTSIFKSLSKKEKYIFSFLIMTMYLIQMPSTSQGFYWLAGAATYQVSIILSVFLVSFFIRYLDTYNKKYLLISILLAFCVIGSNEITMMFVNLIFGVFFLYTSIKHRKINFSVLSLLFFMLIFTIVVIKSPGSASRADTYPGNQQFLYSITKTISATKRHLGDWLPTIIVALLLFFEYFSKNKNLQTPKIFKAKLTIPTIIVFIFPIIGVFPVYYGLKWVPLRTVNVVYFFFLLGIVYLAFLLFFKLKAANKNFLMFSPWVKYLLFALIFIRLGGNNNIRTAYQDLLSGTAYNYDKELRSRYQAIENNKEDVLVIPELTFLPKTIFFEDIRTNSSHWINQCYKNYFDQKEIILTPKKE
ncbi:DUF6056 family protein [Algibacter sp.]|uniref:DUF6056 family protein n=1 Tax=Algibacter sp. TaxID=1872428 RepID=UPI003C75F63E